MLICCILNIVSALYVFPSDRKISKADYTNILEGKADYPTLIFDFSDYTKADLASGNIGGLIEQSQYLPQLDGIHSTKSSLKFVEDIEQEGDYRLKVLAFKPMKETTDVITLQKFVTFVHNTLYAKYNVKPTMIMIRSPEGTNAKMNNIVENIEESVEELLDDLGVLEYLEDHDGDIDNGDDKKHSEEHRIWTEGLLMCLIVSFILLGILLVALSWLSSLTISYGALEKQTAPSKKTN